MRASLLTGAVVVGLAVIANAQTTPPASSPEPGTSQLPDPTGPGNTTDDQPPGTRTMRNPAPTPSGTPSPSTSATPTAPPTDTGPSPTPTPKRPT